MLIITVETCAANVNSLLGGPQRGLLHDLRGVTSVDGAGRECLARAHGNMVVGGGTTKVIVNEIHTTSESEPRSALLRVEGTLRMPVDGVLRSRVESLLRNGVRRVLLDLSGVSNIDAAGVGELIHVFNTAAAAGGVLEIAYMSPRVHRVLDVAGILGLLTAMSNISVLVRRVVKEI